MGIAWTKTWLTDSKSLTVGIFGVLQRSVLCSKLFSMFKNDVKKEKKRLIILSYSGY